MFLGQRVAVVVPAYEEERLVAQAVGSIPSWVDDVIVVDDGSRDRTSERARSVGDPRVTIERHATNRGVGAALETGYARALALGADAVAVMAGDGQMDPRDLPMLLAPLADGHADYVKGDRLGDPAVRHVMPFVRFLGNHVLTRLTCWATGLAVRDSQCGYTAFSRRALASVLDEGPLWRGYGYPNDVLGTAARLRLRVREVPVRPVYADEASGVGWRHALLVVPFVLLRVLARRARRSLPRREPALLSEP